MPQSLQTISYVVASLLFILSLRGLSNQETARGGNLYGSAGMILAVLVTGAALFFGGGAAHGPEAPEAAKVGLGSLGMLAGALGVGGIVGAVLAARVAMTSMPQLVAILHSFVGLAAVLVGVGTYLDTASLQALQGGARLVHLVEIFIGVFVGAVTFTGSLVAWGKLDEKIGSKPLLLPGRHALNLGIVVASVALGALFVGAEPGAGTWQLLAMTGLASALGVHLVMAIGGGDMPVVVSLLNSYSGWAASAAGFMLGNDLLIITGALVGSSGAILSYIMCRAMNRSIWNVVFGGFGGEAPKKAAAPAEDSGPKEIRQASVETTCQDLLAAKSVIIVPGYGMAVAQAQHPLQEITKCLRERGVQVRYAIHPVAGRLPGHMNVLLAEARVPYDIVLEMDEINDDMPETDVVVIVGANDIVNPSALDDTSSPIYGMPVLEVWRSRKVIMLKRGMAAGYAGIDNPLYFHENTWMLFGDARGTINQVLTALRQAGG
jgi:NAD(P) transhydrogenase subunit beta